MGSFSQGQTRTWGIVRGVDVEVIQSSPIRSMDGPARSMAAVRYMYVVVAGGKEVINSCGIQR